MRDHADLRGSFQQGDQAVSASQPSINFREWEIMDRIVSALLVLAGIIHLLPVSGVLGANRLASLYGVSLSDPNLVILMRHRAVLFALLGLFLVYAAFRPSLQPLAFLAGFVSVVSFIMLAGATEGYNESIRKVVIADVVAVVALCIGAIAYVLN